MKKGNLELVRPKLVLGFIPVLSNFRLLHSIPSAGANAD
jgi:hypothetical protein